MEAKKPVNQGPRQLGTLQDKTVEIDPDWWKPMSDKEADDFVNGKY